MVTQLDDDLAHAMTSTINGFGRMAITVGKRSSVNPKESV